MTRDAEDGAADADDTENCIRNQRFHETSGIRTAV
jgi:hypothetical protein